MNLPDLSHIVFSRYTFTLEVRTPLYLGRFPGSTFRGGFGNAFRRTLCVQRRLDCPNCLLGQQCIYSRVFETPVPENARLMRQYPAAPHPFVIEPPETEKREYAPGDRFTFGLVLMGWAIETLPYFIHAFEKLGRMGFGSKIGNRRGNYTLLRVTCEEKTGRKDAACEREIYTRKTHALTRTCPPWSWQDLGYVPAADSLSLHFHTPLRLKYHGRFADHLDFHVFFRSLHRRVGQISYFHCATLPDDACFPELLRQAKNIRTVSHDLHWQEQQRWSGRQKTTMKLGGLVGTVGYAGDLTRFLPWIYLGSALHCGKGCTFGLGRYTLECSS